MKKTRHHVAGKIIIIAVLAVFAGTITPPAIAQVRPSEASPGDEIYYRGKVYKTFKDIDDLINWMVPKGSEDQFYRIYDRGYISFLPRHEKGWVMRKQSGYKNVRWNWTYAYWINEEAVRRENL